MKILITSDNHGNETVLEDLFSIYEKDVMLRLHCGDSQLAVDHPIWNFFQPVRGNTDISDRFPAEINSHIEDLHYFQVHGHLHDVNHGLNTLYQKAKKAGCSFAFYGHTHIPKVDKIGDIYLINPGSLTQPRGDFTTGSYAILEVKEDKKQVKFYDANHRLIPEISQELP